MTNKINTNISVLQDDHNNKYIEKIMDKIDEFKEHFKHWIHNIM